MTKNDNKIFWVIIIIAISLATHGILKLILIKKDPLYIFAKITDISSAKQIRLSFEFVYNNQKYKDGMTASGLGIKIGDYYLIEFQKSNPNNCRPIFNEDSWRCVLNDSSYYYGSSKKPNCEY